MKNSTHFVGMSFIQRLQQQVLSHPHIFQMVGMGFWGFVFAQTEILGIVGPFGGALVAAVSFAYTLPTCVGVVLGYLLTPSPEVNTIYAAMAVAIAILKLGIGRHRWGRFRLVPILTSILATLGAGFLNIPLSGGNVYDYVLLASQGALAGGTAFFVRRLFVKGQPSINLRGRMNSIALLVCVAIGAVGLAGLGFDDVSLGRTLGVLAVTMAGYTAGVGAGASLGVLLGISFGFVSGDFGTCIALYGMGGLFSGVFSPIGRMGSAAAFVFCGGFTALVGGGDFALSTLIEIMVGTMAFAGMPSELLHRTSRLFASPLKGDRAGRQFISSKLDGTVKALEEICDITRQVSHRLDQISHNDMESVPDEVARRVCRRCAKSSACWVEHYGSSVRGFRQMVQAVRRGGEFDAGDYSDEFLRRCGRVQEVWKATSDEYSHFISREGTRRKVSQVRSLVTDQFEGMALYLGGLRDTLESCRVVDPAFNARVADVLSGWSGRSNGFLCLRSGKRISIELLLPLDAVERGDLDELGRLLSESTRRSFGAAQCTRTSDGMRTVFREKPEFRVEAAASQISRRDGEVCGDTHRTFVTDGCCFHIMLSDGMGSGGAAAVDSAMAVSLLSRLVKAGADYDSALRLVNSALLVKSGEESLATIDAAVVDLYSGRVKFYKAGAAPSVICHGGRGGSVESTSLPAGILQGAEFEHSTLSLHSGDWVVLMSDGVSACGVEWVSREVERFAGDSPQNLADRLANAARLRRDDGREDDITVICAHLSKPEES